MGESAFSTVTITVASAYPWYNGIRPLNVNDDGYITPIDALTVINELNANGTYKLSMDRARPLTEPFLDVNRDGYVTPADALWVINYLNSGGDVEGESSTTIADAAAMSRAVVVSAEVYEPVAADSNPAERSSDSRLVDSREPTSFLQSLDLLFAKLDEAPGTETREPVAGRKVTSTGDLEKFLDRMLDGIADEEELLATTAR